MELLNYFLASILVFLGLFVGVIVAFIAKEELKPGKYYFIFLQRAFFSAAVGFIFLFNNIPITISIIISLLILFLVYKTKMNIFLSYLILAFLFNAAFRNTLSAFVVVASLIFLYGIPTGSLLVYENRNKIKLIKEILLKYGIFVPISLVLFLI